MPVTLITGGSSGIGAELAGRLSGAGHQVVVTGRDENKLAEIAAKHDLLALPADASDPAAVESTITTTVETFGRLDNIVANAGVVTRDTIESGDPAGWREMLLTNVLGPTLLINAALPALRSSRGRIVLMGSIAGLGNTPGNLYSVTKWAVAALAENTRLLVAGWGIGVTLVNPGPVSTPLWGAGGPKGQALSSADVAASVCWVLNQPQGVDVNTLTVRPTGHQV